MTVLDGGLLCPLADVTTTSSAVTSRHKDDVLTNDNEILLLGRATFYRLANDTVHDLVHNPLKVGV